MTPDSARDFESFTRQNVGQKLDVRVDGKTQFQPIIRETITGGAGQIPVASAESRRDLATGLSNGSAALDMEIRRD